MTKRAYLTDREKRALLAEQNGLCAICAGKMDPAQIEYDHTIPVALGNGEKPDRAVHYHCHKAKTREDVKRIAKCKRLHRTFVLGERKAKCKIQSRGFDKRWRCRMDGTVTRAA